MEPDGGGATARRPESPARSAEIDQQRDLI